MYGFPILEPPDPVKMELDFEAFALPRKEKKRKKKGDLEGKS